jgi:hypothetical protein
VQGGGFGLLLDGLKDGFAFVCLEFALGKGYTHDAVDSLWGRFCEYSTLPLEGSSAFFFLFFLFSFPTLSEGYNTPFWADESPHEKEEEEAIYTITYSWNAIVALHRNMQDIKPESKDEGVLLKRYCEKSDPTLVAQLAENQSNTEDMRSSLMEIVSKEASRNKWLGSQMNTVEKLIQLRKDELIKKITLLIEERDAYKATYSK